MPRSRPVSPALRRWARYRAQQAAAAKRGDATLRQAEYAKSRDRLWTVKTSLAGRKIRKDGFRTKAGARLWLKETVRAFVRAEKAKSLAALPAGDKTIAKAFERLTGED